MRRLPAPAALLLFVLLLLVAPGCGDDDPDDAAPRSSTTTPSPSSTTTSTTRTTSTTATTTTTTTTTATTATTATTTITTAPSTTAGPGTTGPGTTAPRSSTTVGAAPGAPTPEAAAQSLYLAWKGGDRAAAAGVAEPKAVDAIFARPFTGPDMEFHGCRQDGDIWACPYGYEGGFLAFRVRRSASAGFRVVDVIDAAD